MVSILVILRQLEGVAVLDVLGDVPVVRGPARQAPQAEDLLGRAGRVADSLLSPHLGADTLRQLGELGAAGVLVVSGSQQQPQYSVSGRQLCSSPVAPGIDEDAAVGVHRYSSLDVLH